MLIASACTPARVCIPNETQACLGPGQCAGAQACNAEGSGFSPCDCGASTAHDAGTSLLVRGAAQKGPFIVGASVSIAPLDARGLPMGQVFPSQIANDRGEFSLSVPSVGTGFAELQATGFHYNEVTRTLSTSELTLRSLAPLDGAPSYINVLTHLATERIRALAAAGATLGNARDTAEQELRAALPLGTEMPLPAASELNLLGGDTAANAYLFAVSVLFAQAAVVANPSAIDAELQQLLNTTALDFADGALEPGLVARLEAAERLIDVGRIEAAFAARLAAIGSTAAVPQLDRVIDTDGDGQLNAVDRCPLQAGDVPTTQFCVQSPRFLDFDEQANLDFVVVPGPEGRTLLVGTSHGPNGPTAPEKLMSVRWLSADGGIGPAVRLQRPDGGPMLTGAPLTVRPALDGSGDVIIPTVAEGCTRAAFYGSAGVTSQLDLGCGDAGYMEPVVFQTRSGAVSAFWRSQTPLFHSTWFAQAPRRDAPLGPPVLICSECLPVSATSPEGEVAFAFKNPSGAGNGFSLHRVDVDGGLTASTGAPFASLPTMTFTERGRLLVLWSSQSGTPSELNWATHEAGAWSTTRQVVQGPTDPWPALAGDSSGDAIASFVSNGQLRAALFSADAGSWSSPGLLHTTRAYPGQAILGEGSGAVLWTEPESSRWGINRFSRSLGWGPPLILPRTSGMALMTVVDPATYRVVWRTRDGNLYTALLR